MSPTSSPVVRGEDELGRKWDRCISDSVLKLGGGVTLGAVFSLLLFKRRAWPLIFGSGMGLGMSYSNCQHELRGPSTMAPRKIALSDVKTSAVSRADIKPVSFRHTPLEDNPPQFSDKGMNDTSNGNGVPKTSQVSAVI